MMSLERDWQSAMRLAIYGLMAKCHLYQASMYRRSGTVKDQLLTFFSELGIGSCMNLKSLAEQCLVFAITCLF